MEVKALQQKFPDVVVVDHDFDLTSPPERTIGAEGEHANKFLTRKFTYNTTAAQADMIAFVRDEASDPSSQVFRPYLYNRAPCHAKQVQKMKVVESYQPP